MVGISILTDFYAEPCECDAIQTLGSLQFSHSGVVVPQSDVPGDKVNCFPSTRNSTHFQKFVGNYPQFGFDLDLGSPIKEFQGTCIRYCMVWCCMDLW